MARGAQLSKYDLTTGGIASKMLLVALPIIATQLLLMSYNLVDVFLLGRVGSDAVASAGSAGMYLWLSNGLMMLGRMGAEIGVAQRLGAGDAEAARRYSQGSLVIAAVVGLAYASICGLFSSELIGFYGIREESVARDGARYLSVVATTMPLVFITSSMVGTFNGSGNTRVPFVINTIGLVLNAALDPIFIFVFEMGVVGAAAATAIAQILVFALMLLSLVKKHDRPFERYIFKEMPRRETIVSALRWSAPICVESVLFCGLSMTVSRFIATFGAGALATFRVASNVESLCWLTCIGMSTSVTSFVGQNFGAGRMDRIKAGVRFAFIIATIWGVAVSLLFVLFGGELFGLFLPDASLIEEGRRVLFIFAFCELPGCYEAASSGSFRGLGRTVPPTVASVSCNAFRCVLAWVLSRTIGLHGIWIALSIGAAMRGIVLTPWFLSYARKILK